jgi:hypothetical protein
LKERTRLGYGSCGSNTVSVGGLGLMLMLICLGYVYYYLLVVCRSTELFDFYIVECFVLSVVGRMLPFRHLVLPIWQLLAVAGRGLDRTWQNSCL